MNLAWLDDFLALVASGNFSRAAEERHMTQPNFSRRIRALEEWLGTDLFDRSSQPAKLTKAGEWFRDAAHQMLAQVSRLPGATRAIAEAHSVSLRFAATHALSFTFLAGWLRSMESRTAVGPVTLASDVFTHCEAMLLEGRVQFLLCHAHPLSASRLSTERFPFEHVGDDLLVPASAPDSEGRVRLTLDSATPQRPLPVLTYSTESGIGRILRAVRGSALERLPTQEVFTAHLASVLRTMALDGRGLAWLPRTLIADDLAAGRLVEAGSGNWSIDLEIRLYRDRSMLGDAGEKFWDAVASASRTP